MAPDAQKSDVALPQLERTTPRDDEDREASSGLVLKFLFLLLFFLLLFLLAHSMVEHHFFTGGAMDYNNHPTGP